MRPAQSSSIKHCILVAVLIGITTIGACTDTEGSGETEDRQSPDEFAAKLVELGINGDWSDVRPLLAEPYDEYQTDLLQNGLAFPRWSEDLTDPDQWEVEEHNDFAIARSWETPDQALVLVPDGNSWRYDPGDRALMRIERQRAGVESPGLPRETNGMSENAPYQSTIETDARSSDIHPHLQRQLGPVIAEEDKLDITLHITLREVTEARIPLAGIWARDDSDTMLDTKLGGTTAIIEDGVLIMPLGDSDRSAYQLQLSVQRPEDANSLELMFEDLELIDPARADVEALEFDLHYEDLAIETLPDFLDG